MSELNRLNIEKLLSHNLTIIVISATLIRIVLYFMFDFASDLHGGDSSYYLETGRSIVERGVHGPFSVPSFYRPPLYSLFAGIVASISEAAVLFYFVQSALFIGFSICVYFLLLRHGTWLAFLSALLIAVSPFDALMNGRVLSENFVTPLLVLGTLIFVHADNSKMRFLISGALLGGAALSRDVYLLLPVVFLLGGFFIERISWRYLVVFLLGFVLMVSPWVYRNSQMPDGGIFLSKGILWKNLWVGVWERNADWTHMPNPYVPPPEALLTFDSGNSPAADMAKFDSGDDKFFREVTINYVLNHPLKVIYTWAVRYPLLWFGTRSDLNTSYFIRGEFIWYFMKIAFYIANAALVIFGMIGMIVAMRNSRLPLLLCLPVIYNASIYIPFHNVETRYSLPVLPILCIYFSLFVVIILKKKPNDSSCFARSCLKAG